MILGILFQGNQDQLEKIQRKAIQNVSEKLFRAKEFIKCSLQKTEKDIAKRKSPTVLWAQNYGHGNIIFYTADLRDTEK